jgi:hypothetical protein
LFLARLLVLTVKIGREQVALTRYRIGHMVDIHIVIYQIMRNDQNVFRVIPIVLSNIF